MPRDPLTVADREVLAKSLLRKIRAEFRFQTDPSRYGDG